MELKRYKLGEICPEFHAGNGIQSSQIKGSGLYPVFGGNGLRGYTDTFNQDGQYLIIGRQGAYCGNVRYNVGKAFLTEHAIVGQTSAEHNAIYLACKLSLMNLAQFQGQSAQPGLSVKNLSEIEILMPPKKIQDNIARVILNIDHKIALNRAINQNLEAMAKQLYDYWFVQFDFPNEEGKPYKSSGGKMVWNEKIKREIPIGWEILPLFDAVSVQYGFPFATEQFTEEKTDVPVVRIRDILEGTTSAYSLEKADEKYHLNENDVLVGMDGNFHMNFWHDNIAYLNQRCVRLRAHSDSTISSIQILHSIKPYIKAKEQNAKGSTVGHLSDKDLKGLYLIKPLKTRVFNSRKTLDGLLALVIENKKQILSLTKQRDELLPLLMNGQVSPPNCD